jgi:phycobilisome core component
LRYSSYAIIAGNLNILNERVLDGLRETYNSLEVPIGPTVRSIRILQEIITEAIRVEKIEILDKSIVDKPFQHIIKNLSEQNL